MKDGILVLNKPQNWTSHDCVAICRRVLRLKGVKKIGHGGTLDPMAEGVLPIFIGQATRIMEYLDLDYKTYTGRVQLGLTSDTQDIWGTVLEKRPFDGITEEQVRVTLAGFEGIIEQIPPAYSAVRIDGKRLYEYAYKGRTDEARELAKSAARRIHVRQITVHEIDMEQGTLCFTAECSKGTYIRTICADLGQKLGCGAVMTGLVRRAIGGITLDGAAGIAADVPAGGIAAGNRRQWRAVSPEEIKAMEGDPALLEQLEGMLLAPDQPLHRFGEVTMPADRAKYFRQGNSIRLYQVRKVTPPRIEVDPLTGEIPCNARGRRYDRIYRVYQQENGLFLGTGYEDPGQKVLKADKVFTALNQPKNRGTDEDF